ncbi:MAG: FHA domain-containing protein [Chloroflexota bacterium]
MASSTASKETKDHLIIHNPDGSVTKVPIPETSDQYVSLGRELDNDVSLNDPRASRHHAKIRRVDEDRLEIMDIGSANGTTVGATVIEVNEWHSFSPGQVAQIGDSRIMWEQSVTSQSTVAMTPITGPQVTATPKPTKRNDNMVFVWMFGVLIVLLLAVLGWALFNSIQPPDIEVAVVTSETQGDPPANIDQQTPEAAPANISQQTPEAAPTETPLPTPTPLPTIPLEPAQPSVILESIEYLPVISGALFDREHVYMIVDVRVENLGDEPFVVSTDRFQAITKDNLVLAEFGQQFPESEFSRLGLVDRFENLSLGSGGSVSEELVFFLDDEPYELDLLFLPDNLPSIRIGLGNIDAAEELAQLVGQPTTAPAVASAATATPEATPTSADTEADAEPTDTPTPVPTRADGTSRTIAATSLRGTVAFPDFNGASYDLYIGNVSTGNVSLWRNESSQPIFSHDGTRLAFHSWAEGSRGLVTANLDRSNETLVATFLEDQLPTWSADDSKILFLSRRTGGRQSQLYMAPSDQFRPEAQFVIEGEYPTWSDNGTVVFKGWVSTGVGLQVASNQITDYQPLTDNDADTGASISPDGTQVAFMSRRDDNWDIYVVNIDGTGLRRLTRDAADDGLPTWSPDGRAIAFVSNRGGPWAIWAMTARGTGIRQLFTMQGSPDGFVASEPTTDTTRGWAEERITWTDQVMN